MPQLSAEGAARLAAGLQPGAPQDSALASLPTPSAPPASASPLRALRPAAWQQATRRCRTGD
eukprot:5659411-Alexandrium_andersonii.AAC.1